MKRLLRTTVIAVTALACAVVIASPAAAAPSTKASPGAGLDAVKHAVADRIDKRLDALKGFATRVEDAKQLDAGHRSTLTTLINSSTTGLTALKTKVLAETTGAAVKADAESMVNDYRVFILIGPKVRLTIAIDLELAVIAKLRALPNVDKGKLDAIQQTLSGKVDTLLAIKPGPDGEGIRKQVSSIRADAKDAHAALKALRKTK